MTHPHRINVCTNADIGKGILVGFVKGGLSFWNPAAIVWFFFGRMLPGVDRAAQPPKQAETGVKI